MMGKMPRLYCPTFPKHDQIELPSISVATYLVVSHRRRAGEFLILFDGAQAVAYLSIGLWVENGRNTFWKRRLRVSRHAVFVFQVR